MSELVDKNGETIKDVQFNIKKESGSHLADRKALHSGQGSTKPFKDMDDLEKMASNIYATAVDDISKEYEADKKAGLDINDLESIKNYKLGYTPIGETLIVKYIKEEQKVGSLILPDSTSDSKKAIIITPGLYISTLFKGDIVILKGQSKANPYPYEAKRTFNGITFNEIPVEAVAGVFHEREDIIQKIKDANN